MKHEAFVEAVSMLDDKFVEEALKPFPKRSSAPALRICFAAAACAAAICAFLFIPRGKAADILVRGENPSVSPIAITSEDDKNDAVRTHAFEAAEIPVEITADAKTTVSVSDGTVSLVGKTAEKASSELEIDRNAEILWSVVLANTNEEFTLTVKTGNHSRVLALVFDEGANDWVVREKSAY